MAKTRRPSPCDPEMVTTFDYSGLAPELTALGKPAQRALITAGLKTPAQIARKTKKDILALHGMGPGSMPKIEAALKKKSLKFKGG